MPEAGNIDNRCGEEAMEALHIQTTLTQDGRLVLDSLPFQAGTVASGDWEAAE